MTLWLALLVLLSAVAATLAVLALGSWFLDQEE